MALFVPVFEMGSTVAAQEPSPRNLDSYIKDPLITLDPFAKDYYKQLDRLVSVLWQHWIHHERAIVRVDSHSKYHSPAAVVYFLEQDASGKWSVAVEKEYDRVNITTKAKEHYSIRFRAYSVRRVSLKDCQSVNKSITRDTYGLILEDADGKVLDRL
jgi:hypothetical protein